MLGWIIGGVVALGAGLGSLALVANAGQDTTKKYRKLHYPKPARPGPGWYVLLYEEGDYLKEYRGPSATKAEAEEIAKKARAGGWRGDNARAVVEHRARAPF